MKTLFSFLILSLFLSPHYVSSAEKDKLVFGVHPFKSPAKLHSMFRPVLNDLSRLLGKDIVFTSGKSYEHVLNRYRNGEIDFGYLGPAAFVSAHRELGLVPLVRIMPNGIGSFRGVIVVREDSPIQTISQLKGKKFAFGDANSTLSHYVPRYMLKAESILLDDLAFHAFTGKHDNVARGVLFGKFDAGGLKPSVAKQYLDKGLRILATSDAIAEHLFVANNQMSDSGIKILKKALFNVEIGRLKSIKSNITGLEEAHISDYRKIKKIIEDIDKDM